MQRNDRLPRWVVVWLVVSMAIVAWDVAFVLARPASLPDGALGWLWKFPYATYIGVDLSYGDMTDAFVPTQALMSLVEIVIGIAALVANRRGLLGRAALLALVSCALTCAKTTLIFVQELLGGMAHVGHNALPDLLGAYVIPNAVWVVVPLLVVRSLGRLLVKGFNAPPATPR